MKKPLDHIVKEALENLQVPYDPTSWEDMQHRIDHEIGTEIDDDIKSSVSDLNVGYQHKHWLQLKQWLDFTWYASNKVYISKAAECGLMLLALFTFFNYIGSQARISPALFAETMPAAHESTAINSASDDQIDRITLQAASNTTAESKSEKQTAVVMQPDEASSKVLSDVSNKLAAAATPGKSKYPTNVSSETPTTSNSGVEIGDGQVGYGSPDKNPTVDRTTSNLVEGGPSEHSEEEIVAEAVSSEVDMLGASSPEYLQSSALAVVDNLPTTVISALNTAEIKTPDPQLLALNTHGEKRWAISAFSDLGFNHISTPYDALYEKSGYNQNRIGIGGGLRVHRAFGPVEISAGMTYSSLKYNPKEFIELFKRSPESEGTVYRFEGIELNLLSIPVHANYYINKTGKWHAYVAAGGAIHLALQAEYEKDAEMVPSAVPIPEFINENEGATVTVGRTPNFEIKNFPDGLLENGSFRDNHYFTLDVGIGVERKISKSTSIFTQPTVYYNLFNKGLSANNDKINTFTLQLGAKTKF